MKILITSDNHLGYKENDDIRGNDSFNTFEEILHIANLEKVDFILQGGDLFHDNRPSRYCIDRTIQILSKYCTGKDRTKIDAITSRNFQSKNIQISIPVLAIHGNHDDPSGLNKISALNILHSAGYISYVGKFSIDNMVISPIVVKNVAIYAIGHIKDKILYSLFIEGKVKFERPSNSKDLYNVLILHQNRVQRNNEYIPEAVLDDFFDLVVYGHEHDSNITMGRFVVLQSGSTVRTSLCDSETGDKYCYILTIDDHKPLKKQQPVINKVKLITVRNFVMKSVKIETDKLEEEVEELLEKMIVESNEEFDLRKKQLQNRTNGKINGKKLKKSDDSDINCTKIIEDPVLSDEDWMSEDLRLPLLRLRVETTGVKFLNNHKLSYKFKGRVANPTEILRFIRKRIAYKHHTSNSTTNININEMIKSKLNPLGVILGDQFMDSLENFTVKDDKDSFNRLINENVERLLTKIDLSKILIDDLENEVRRINKVEEDRLSICDVKSPDNFNIIRNDESDDEVGNYTAVETLSMKSIKENKDSLKSNCIVDTLNSNTSFLVSNSSAAMKDISFDIPDNISFSSKNSREARKMLNTIHGDTRDLLGLCSDTNIIEVKNSLSSAYDPKNPRKLFDEEEEAKQDNIDIREDSVNKVDLEDISSDLFDF